MSWRLQGEEQLASWRGEAGHPGQKGRKCKGPRKVWLDRGAVAGLYSEDKEALKHINREVM